MRRWKSDSPIRYSERGKAAYRGKGRGRARRVGETLTVPTRRPVPRSNRIGGDPGVTIETHDVLPP